MSDVLESKTLAETDANQEVLVFRLGDEEYAVDILKVQEIRGYSGVTRIPNAPSFIKGVTNLRGAVVPIVDLRIKFGLESVVYGAHTVVVVLNTGARIVGVVVDSVSDVVTLTAEQILPAPDFGSAVATRFLQGLANLEERMLILVDIEAMMSSKELALVEDVEAGSASG